MSELVSHSQELHFNVKEKELVKHPDFGAALGLALLLIVLICPPLMNVVCDTGWVMGIVNGLLWVAGVFLVLFLFVSVWPVWALVLSVFLWNLVSCILLLIIYNP
ncbi:MAG: hypothetical protein IAF38_18225 [Bacteroidia bacterium]|nr:hypothetical protein [Bacteroidia bacterium]